MDKSGKDAAPRLFWNYTSTKQWASQLNSLHSQLSQNKSFGSWTWETRPKRFNTVVIYHWWEYALCQNSVYVQKFINGKASALIWCPEFWNEKGSGLYYWHVGFCSLQCRFVVQFKNPNELNWLKLSIAKALSFGNYQTKTSISTYVELCLHQAFA